MPFSKLSTQVPVLSREVPSHDSQFEFHPSPVQVVRHRRKQRENRTAVEANSIQDSVGVLIVSTDTAYGDVRTPGRTRGRRFGRSCVWQSAESLCDKMSQQHIKHVITDEGPSRGRPPPTLYDLVHTPSEINLYSSPYHLQLPVFISVAYRSHPHLVACI